MEEKGFGRMGAEMQLEFRPLILSAQLGKQMATDS